MTVFESFIFNPPETKSLWRNYISLSTKRPGCSNTFLFLSKIFGATVAWIFVFLHRGGNLAGAFYESFLYAQTSPWSSHWVAFKTCLWFLCYLPLSRRSVGFCGGLCQFPSICREVARGEFKSLLAFIILQLQELLQSQQFPMLMQGLSLVNNCTFDNIKHLENKREQQFSKSSGILSKGV